MNDQIQLAIANRAVWIEQAAQPEEWKEAQRLDLRVIACAAEAVDQYRDKLVGLVTGPTKRAIDALDQWAVANQPGPVVN